MPNDGSARAYSTGMSNLTEKGHWDVIHLEEQGRLLPSSRLPAAARVVAAVKQLLGPGVVERMSAYDDYLLWDVILPRYVPRMNGAAAVEIGSAPGDYIVRFSQRHGYIPYGIEYSEIGVEVNRTVFGNYGFDPDNVIQADVFSDEFATRYKERFDVVLSKGFIEHFEDVPSVIDRHVNLLKPGGYLIVTIPNLRGANNILARLFDETSIPRHNVKIMRKKIYPSLFLREDLQELFCDYYGTFSFYLFTATSSIRRQALRTLHRLQPLLNLSFRTVFGEKGAETATFSPFLIYIGRKIVQPRMTHVGTGSSAASSRTSAADSPALSYFLSSR
jgi:SAM-dependent methyltransferase